MEKIVYNGIEETLYYQKLDNGLEVFLLPRPEYNKTYASFTTKYGSIDNEFAPLNTTELKRVPDGIAHFLEHKMFEKEDGDVFYKFSTYGANANAFTSFNRTAYLFSSTDKVWENLELLIDMAQSPYFTKETVEKEKGIIGQEINMYDDDPDWRTYFGTIENMYHNHPVKIDIAGTIESISEITAELLYECYHTFYHPSNMVLFVVGKFDANEYINKIIENQSKKEFEEAKPIVRGEIDEPTNVAIPYRELELPIKTPKLLMGIKQPNPDVTGKDKLKREQVLKMALDILFSRSSVYFEQMLNDGLINDSFSYEYEEEGNYGFALIGGDTNNPEALMQKLKEICLNIQIDEEAFTRTKRRKIGGFISALNSLEYIANSFTRYYFNDMNLFSIKETLNDLDYKYFIDEINKFFKEDQITFFITKPKK